MAGDRDILMLEDQTLRDGLQMETRMFRRAEKRALYDLLSRAGIRRIQAGAFVHPRTVPQMADTDDLLRAVERQAGAQASALVLNSRGMQRALDCGAKHVTLSASVSNTHSLRNTRMPAEAALGEVIALGGQARDAGVDFRVCLQCVFGCVYEGPMAADTIIRAVAQLAAAGVGRINLADTTGMATPLDIGRMVERLRAQFPEIVYSLHLHDTRGLGLANMYSGYQCGIRSFDVCTGGLGGCPAVPGAAGNVPTEDAVNMFESMGIPTGIDLAVLCEAVAYLESRLERTLPGRMGRVLAAGREIQSGGRTAKESQTS